MPRRSTSPILTVDGHGDPNTGADFQGACNVLYALAYTLKFALKSHGVEFTVPPPEALWWTEDMANFGLADKSAWHWTAMIMQPPPVTAEWVEEVHAAPHPQN